MIFKYNLLYCLTQMKGLDALILILLTFFQGHAQEEGKKVPCKPDWYFFGGNCYKLGRDETGLLELNWEDAVEKCTEYGARLVTIHSKALQRFLEANLLLDAKKHTWIAFSRPGARQDFEWHDGSPVVYTNWGRYQPHKYYGVEGEDCVNMRYDNEKIMGKWHNSKCNVNLTFVCKMEQDLKLSSPDLRYCPDALRGGRMFRDSCFNIVNKEKNWQEAEEYCVQHYDGHLVTVPDVPTKFFLDSILDKNYDGDYWVGIHIENFQARKGLIKWSSGRYVDVNLGDNFKKSNISNSFESEAGSTDVCVSFTSDKKPWELDTCDKFKPFICEYSLKNSSSQNQLKVEDFNCPIASGNIDEWVDLGGDQCYYFSKKTVDSIDAWSEANFHCMQRGGFLASIHSQEELDDLKQFFSYYVPNVHIGLFRIQNKVDRFRWADGSEVNFEAWDEGEPHDTNWIDECVQIKFSSMKWQTIGCIMEVEYSICSIKKTHVQKEENSVHVIYSNKEKEMVPCLPGWYYIDGKCYKEGRDEAGLLELSWDDAAAKCVEYGGHFITIHSWKFKDEFINTFLYEIKKKTWIGLRRTSGEDSFTWHDGSPVDYTNWDRDRSTIPGKQEDCVEALDSFWVNGYGKWKKSDCGDKKPFICQMEEDPDLSSPDVRFCPQALGGGRRFRDSCLHLVNKEKNWGDAEEHCVKNYNGHLFTIPDEFAIKFFDYFLGKNSRNEYWIGIHLQTGLLQKWSSGRYVDLDVVSILLHEWNQTYNQSIYDVSSFCAILNERGYWDVANCKATKYFICQMSLPKKPSTKLKKLPINVCPGNFDDWLDLGGDKCYYISKYRSSSWYEANHECMKRGSYLTSIHSQEELDALVEFLSYRGEEAFIGLFRSLKSNQFLWADGSKLDFEAWEEDQPNNRSQKCALLNGRTSKWRFAPCNSNEFKKYICLAQKFPSDAYQYKSGTFDQTS